MAEGYKYSLVFSGGGSKIPLHTGAVSAIEDKCIDFNKVCGVSAGSIISACLALGMDSKEMMEIISKADFKSFIEEGRYLLSRVWSLIRNGSMAYGESLYSFLKDIFGDVKFSQTQKSLYVIAHSLRDRGPRVFCSEETPEVKIVDALRASCAIPFGFSPFEINGERFIDGGVSKGFPIDLSCLGDNVIGNIIYPENEFDANQDNISFWEMSSIVLDNVFAGNIEASLLDAERMDKRIFVARAYYPLSMFDFDVSQEQKSGMFKAGRDAMDLILEKIVRDPCLRKIL